MVNAFAESAKLYCRWWGPLGGPMSRGIDAWAQMQRGYLHWLGKTSGPRGGSSDTSQYREGASTAESGAREAQRIARESAREAQRIAGEAERNAREAERSASEGQRSPEKDLRNTIRESVSRSEAAGQEEGPRLVECSSGDPKVREVEHQGNRTTARLRGRKQGASISHRSLRKEDQGGA